MRVLVAGASGVIGSRLVPLLTAVGHDVVALARSSRRTSALEALGVDVVVADALDRDQLLAAVRRAAPDAVVNLLTAIPADINPRHMAEEFALTNRLRTEGTRNLMEAGRRVGVRRIVAQGLAYGYQPGAGLANEDAPLWHDATPRPFAPVLAALVSLEEQTVAAGGTVLRFGHLYGPGSAYAADGAFTAHVRAGKVPLVGGGNAVFSFTHADDAATAIVAALDRVAVGALNVVDDDPAPLHTWLPEFAARLGAPAPKRAPAALARLAVGGWGVAFMNRLRGADNARACLTLNWRPGYASWRDGLSIADAAGTQAGPSGSRPDA
ncbi:NAD-dependent epimerase/dehydratase family protein [Actinacidiphila paucisporea]|uniref:Nucleoside-diphosphate-sugar epimerase n=1 Tax=Actinacidiphila paucisporea TaxID=310782 RepID=A0A1M7Q9Z2_9ACTN|nr:NAD(P)-dependent oxidoreductase [Actinacidiphila paucisporea]SHN27392.1 Nucleoside-diphosphate-sugar epimerase [Actinacidiphila paucisporea]